MSDQKVQGTVKWFSNKKGYGFVTPAEGSPITEDIFVHQSSIKSEGYRTLDEGWIVEFEVGHDEDGKVKAVNVTAPGGGPCTGPRHQRRRRDRRPRSGDGHEGEPAGEAGAEGGGRGRRRGGEKKAKEPFWHDILEEDVKEALKAKEVRTTTGTIDVSVGSARVKLGTRGYSSMAHADAIIAEGTFSCEANGQVSFEWKHSISFDKSGGEWKQFDANSPELVSSLSLVDDNVGPVGADETSSTLWGDGPADPRSALEENGFEMRRVVLTPRKRR